MGISKIVGTIRLKFSEIQLSQVLGRALVPLQIGTTKSISKSENISQNQSSKEKIFKIHGRPWKLAASDWPKWAGWPVQVCY